MKKILVLVFFLVIAAACTKDPANNNGTANANSGETKPATGLSEADITAREKAVWETLKKKDYDAFANTLAPEYIEVEDDGVYDKAATGTTIKDFAVAEATFSDWKVLPIDKDAVIVTYNLNLTATYKGTKVPPGPYRVSSAWVNRDGKWLGIYYQETLAKTGAPPPPPAATPAATSGPATKPAETTPGSDPIANEKLIWEALKNKNFDGFAALLAPESIEVEPDGIYDKSGSVKSVSMFDSSQASQSDWKTAKINNDASLVTYLVSIPGAKPDKERHSTIWVNRNGKWMALFHQGTPVATPAPAKPK